jgi:Uma2 family endonuclease
MPPSKTRRDREEKLPKYVSVGVSHAWLIDPDIRTQKAYENQNGKWLLLAAFESDDRARSPRSTP